MAAQILPMPGINAPSTSIKYLVRETGHRQLSDLHAHGYFSARRVVVERGSAAEHQGADSA